MTGTLFSLLRVRRFLPLFLTQFLGALNDSLFKNALFILVTYTLASQAQAEQWVTLGGTLFILPSFLFSATAGHLADHFDKARIARYSKCLECLIMILAAIGFCYNHFFLLLLALFLIGTQTAFFGPIKYAILPDHLYPKELVSGNALIEASTFLAILFGTLLGGLFIGIPHGEKIVSLVIVWIAIFGLATSLTIPQALPTQATEPIAWNILSETIKVIGYAMKNRRIFLTIVGISWFWLVGATFLTLLAIFTRNILHASSEVVTFFLSLFSIGIGIGSYVCTKIQKDYVDTRVVPWGTIGLTIFIVDLVIASSNSHFVRNVFFGFTAFFHSFSHWRISLDLLFIAICSGIYIVPLYTLLQTQTEPSHRARVIAANNIFNALFMVISTLSSMLLLDLGLSILHLFLLVAMINVGIAVMLKLKLDTSIFT